MDDIMFSLMSRYNVGEGVKENKKRSVEVGLTFDACSKEPWSCGSVLHVNIPVNELLSCLG